MSIAYDYSRDGSPVTITPAAKPKLLLIDGRRIPSASGRTFESLSPATEQVIATVAEGNEITSIARWPLRVVPSKVRGVRCVPPNAVISCSNGETF